ncbi:hypothetical protein [Egicoccus sp. AB-alg6-2]|uniref:hypothetical protein n=1 Tax=Egicoccus sp. AB-alg6-2 TaxID=3242692 RepID=UPI00359E7557
MEAVRRAAWLFAAALLLGVAGASAPAFLSVTGTSLLHDELDKHGDRVSALWVGVSSTNHPDAVRSAEGALRREIGRHGRSDIRRTAVGNGATVVVDGRPRHANLVATEGGMEALGASVAAPGATRVAITEMTAGQLGLDAPQTLTLVGSRAAIEVTVDAVVPDFDYFAMPDAWQPVAGRVADDENILTSAPAPAVLTDPETLLGMIAAVDHGAPPPPVATRVPIPPTPLDPDATADDAQESLAVAATTLSMVWDVDAGAVETLADARATLPPVVELHSQLVDWNTEVGAAMFAATSRGWGSSGPSVGGQLVPAVERTETSLAVLARPVRGLGLAGQLLVLGVVGAAAARAYRGRLSRASLLAVRGVSPPAVAARATIGAAPPFVAGITAGWALGRSMPVLLGLGAGVGHDVGEAFRRDAPLALAFALFVVAVVVGVTAAVRAQPTTGERRVPPVVEVASLALVAAAWWGRGSGRPVLERGDGTADVDVVALALPLLLVVAAAAIGARLLRWALAGVTGVADRAESAWRWRGGVYLAFRRLRQLSPVTTLLVFVTASGVGLLVAGGVLAASSEATIREKAGITVGGDARLTVPRGVLNSADAMTSYGSLPVPTTQVRRIGDGLLDDRREVDVLTVDPQGFAAVAHQPASLGEDLDDLLADLAPAAGDGQAVEVIAVGTGIRNGMVLHLPGLELPVRVVRRVAAFPGITGQRPAVVLAHGGVLDPDDVVMRARLLPITRTELWLGAGDGGVPALRDELERAGFRDELLWAEDFLTAPTVAPVRATFTFVRGQAAVLAALGLTALLAHHLALARERALSAALVGRMGLPRRSLSAADAVESAVLVAASALIGTGAGLLAARLVVADYDPMPDLPLPMVVRVPLGSLWPLLVLAAIAVAATVLLAHRATRAADVAAMLREAA